MEAAVTTDYFVTTAEEAKKRRKERFANSKKQIDEINKKGIQLDDVSIGGDSLGIVEDVGEPDKSTSDHHTLFRYSTYCKDNMATQDSESSHIQLDLKKNEDNFDTLSIKDEAVEEIHSSVNKKQRIQRSKSAHSWRKGNALQKDKQNKVVDETVQDLSSTTKQDCKDDKSAKVTVVKSTVRPSSASSITFTNQAPHYATWKGSSSKSQSPNLSKEIHVKERDVAKLKVKTQLHQRSHWKQVVNPSLPTCQQILLRHYVNRFDVKYSKN